MNTSSPIFSINQASCSYSGRLEDRVLYIEHLEIPRGEVVFLLGASGSGKSTLLETLGLMNQTLVKGEILFHGPADEEFPFSTLWDKGETNTGKLRRDHFSFIFQYTNLMDNFSAYENIALSRMIKEGVDMQEVIPGAAKLMDEVGLPLSQVDFEKEAVNLSGGQRQRVAFVRALNTRFSVLFGDEPTGNLDENNANELMRQVRLHLQPYQSAIIVSHDINLAIRHADRIIAITSNESERHGEVLPDHIFLRPQWENLQGESAAKFREKLSDFYRVKKQVTEEAKPEDKLLDKLKFEVEHSQFRRLFLKREGTALLGLKKINLLILTAILGLTLLAVGFANGSLAYLEEKLSSPFVNWLTLEIPAQRAGDFETIANRLKSPSLRTRYQIEDTRFYTMWNIRFWNHRTQKATMVRGRTIRFDKSSTEEPLVKEILSKKIAGSLEGLTDSSRMSLIVTEKFLTEFGYDPDSGFVLMEFKAANPDSLLLVPVYVRAIVKELPGKNDYLVSEEFSSARTQPDRRDCPSTFDIRDQHSLRFLLLDGTSEEVTLIRSTIDNILVQSPWDTLGVFTNTPYIHTNSFLSGYEIPLLLGRLDTNTYLKEMLVKTILSSPAIQPFSDRMRRSYEYSIQTGMDCIQPRRFNDGIAIQLASLDSIRGLAENIASDPVFNPNSESGLGGEKATIALDLGKVQEKENFLFLSRVTRLGAYLLILLGAAGVSLFVANLLKMHLEKIKMNIGTFKAFGLERQQAQAVYFEIILRFVGLGLLMSVAIALFLGYSFDLILSNDFSAESDRPSYFQPFGFNTLLTLGVLSLAILITSRNVIRNMLAQTPGDLIYNRE